MLSSVGDLVGEKWRRGLTGDDENVSIRCVFCNSLGKVADDGSVGVEEVVTGHTRLAGDTGRNDNNLDTLESFSELLSWVTDDFRRGVDMGDVSTNTGSTTDVVQAQRGDERVSLEQEGERLANATFFATSVQSVAKTKAKVARDKRELTTGTKNCDLCQPSRRRGEGAQEGAGEGGS